MPTEATLSAEHEFKLREAVDALIKKCGANLNERAFIAVDSGAKPIIGPRGDYQVIGSRGEAVYAYLAKLKPRRLTLTINVHGEWGVDYPANAIDHHVFVLLRCFG